MFLSKNLFLFHLLLFSYLGFQYQFNWLDYLKNKQYINITKANITNRYIFPIYQNYRISNFIIIFYVFKMINI